MASGENNSTEIHSKILLRKLAFKRGENSSKLYFYIVLSPCTATTVLHDI